MRSLVGCLVLIAATVSAVSCGPAPLGPADSALPGPETAQLLAALRRGGATAEVAEVMPQTSMPFFSVPAVRVLVDAADVHVFEFGGVAETDRAAARVAADGGSIEGTQILWASTPHLFRGNRLIVLYAGRDAGILQALSALLGPQFAGR